MRDDEYMTKAEHDRRLQRIRALFIEALDTCHGEILRGLEGHSSGQLAAAIPARAPDSAQAETGPGSKADEETSVDLVTLINDSIKRALGEFMLKAHKV